jgi:hypothetical protein
MVDTSNTPVPTDPTPPPMVPIVNPLDAWIDHWKKEGITLELIITMIMSNPQGTGAMDMASSSIAGITHQSDILSDVQSDVITLNSILSKIESQLGTTATPDISKFPKSLIKQFQSTYKKLFGDGTLNKDTGGDLGKLASFETKFPTLLPVVTGIQGFEKDFQSPVTIGSSTFTFADDIKNYDPNGGSDQALDKDITALAAQHYAANHPGTTGDKGTDLLQTWWTDGNTGQQLVSGQSQQNTTQVQSYMQLLQGFDSTAQQDIQLASTQKSQMIQNEKTS